MAETLVVMGRIPETDCHVTFAFKHNCSKEEKSTLVFEMTSLIGPILPLSCRISPELIKVGKKGELDAYQIVLEDDSCATTLSKFWHDHQRRQAGHEMFPFNLHATLKTDEKRIQMEALLAKGGTFKITEIYVRTLKTKKVLSKMVYSK